MKEEFVREPAEWAQQENDTVIDVVEKKTLDVLKGLLSCRGEGYAINIPLRIKIPESELLLESFNNGGPFPHGFNSTSITDTNNGPSLPASAFTAGDKVAV